MTQTLDNDHAASITELKGRHAKLMTAVQSYTGNSVTKSTQELDAARLAILSTIDAKEQSLLGLAQRKATRPLPSMILDFREQVFLQGNRIIERGRDVADLLQVVRGSSKWCFGQGGNLREFPPNTVAYAYDPMTQASLGISLEGNGTNYLPYSTDMTNSNVTKIGCSIVVSPETSPVIGKSAFLMTTTTTGGALATPGTFSVTNGTRYTVSILAKGGTADAVRVEFNNVRSEGMVGGRFSLTGATAVNNNANWVLAEQRLMPNGWTFARIQVVANRSGNDASISIGRGSNATTPAVGETLHLAHWQVEDGYGSSLIPTGATPVTRAADNMLRDLSFEHNPNGFSFYVEGIQTTDTGSLVFYSLNNSTSKSIRVGAPSNNSALFWLNYDRLANMNVNLFPNFVKGGTNRIAVSVNATRVAVCCNGTVSYTSTPSTGIPLFNRAKLGAISDTNNAINGTIAEFRAYPMALEADDLIALTTQ